MKLLFCDNAGYANYTHRLCNAVSQRLDGDSVCYLTDKNNPDLASVGPNVCVDTSVAAYDAACTRLSPKWFADRLTLPLRILATRNHAIKKHAPDILFLQAFMPLFDQFALRQFAENTKVVLTVHNVIPHGKNYLWSYKSLKRVYANADRLIVHTEEGKKSLTARFGINESKITVINHGTDLTYNRLDPAECRRTLKIYDEKPVLLLYGGIRDYKGLDVLLPALAGIDCHIVIAGAMQGGGSFAPYEEQIDKYGLDTRCYIERVSEEFTDVLFQSCDFVVFPYKQFHSQSGVFMQAIKYGKHVIATDVGSFRSFVDTFALGFICEPNNSSALHECIVNAVRCMGTLGDLSGVSKSFSWESSAGKYKEVANALLK